MIEVVGDFETRSRLILGKTSLKRGSHSTVDDPAPGGTNAYKYAAHPSTEVLCFGYSVDGWPEEIWRPGLPFPFADEWPNILLRAQNAEFEWAIWNCCCARLYGWPKLEPHQIECIAARACYYGLPRKLDLIGQTLGLGHMAKDQEGHRNMLLLSKPKGAKVRGCELVGGKFDDTPARHARNEQYCRQDVVTERIVRRICPPMPENLRRLWHVHREINERGVPVDVGLCKTAVRLVNMENARLGKQLEKITGIEGITPDDTPKLKAWLGQRGTITPDWPRTKPTKNFPNGQPVLNKEVVPAALAGEYGELPDDVRKVFEIRELSADAAVAKYSSILRYEQEGRCRGCHAFYTAGTGRFSGVGVQVQNQRRLEPDEDWLADRLDVADQLPGLLEGCAEKELNARGGVIPTLGGMVRLAICAKPGHVLVVVDWSAIEMRMLHWLAGDERTLEQIRAYDNGVGVEPYKLAAAEMFGVKAEDVTKAQRQQGKVRVLGCGYMTGANKYQSFAKQYGLDLPMDVCQEHVQGYRRSNPFVKRFWYALGKAAVAAVKDGGRHRVGYLEYYMTGHTLNCRLPSGRELKYYDAKIIDGKYGEEVEAIDMQKPKKGGGGAGRRAISMPILTENADSGACFDIMAEAHLKAHDAGLPVVLHVHDEICIESPESKADEHLRTLQDIMKDVPGWARGLPLAVSGGYHRRYTK